MSDAAEPSLEGFAGCRAASVLWSKLVDAAAVIILIRALSRADYGIVGLAAGWQVALGFLNVAPENILWRDYRRLFPSLPQVLGACVSFWLFKTLATMMLAVGIAWLTFQTYHEPLLLVYLPASVLFASFGTLAFIFELPLAVAFEYRRVARLTVVLRALWLAMVTTMFYWPTLTWLLTISASYYAIHIAAWKAASQHNHPIVWPRFRDTRQIVSDALLNFVIWQHLASAVRAFLLRGDLALLGLLGIALGHVGNYLIGLNVAAFALILPGVMEMTVTAGLAHSSNALADARIVRRASVWNALLVVAQLVGFAFFGGWFLRMLVHGNASEILYLAWPLVLGSLLMGLWLPYQAQAMVRGSAATLCRRVFLPVAVAGAAMFAIGGSRWGLPGIAWAHVANSLILGAALLIHRRRQA